MPAFIVLEVDKKDTTRVSRQYYNSPDHRVSMKLFEEVMMSSKIKIRENIDPANIMTNRPDEIYYEGVNYSIIFSKV